MQRRRPGQTRRHEERVHGWLGRRKRGEWRGTPGGGGTCSFSGTAQGGGSGSNGAGGGGGGSTTCSCGWGGPGGAGGNGAAGTVTQKQVPPPNVTYSSAIETYFKYDAKG